MRHILSTHSTLVLTVVLAMPAVPLTARQAPESATVFAVREPGAGDLNGDGDMFDSVWHVYDAKTDTTTNLGMATASVCSDGFLPPPQLFCVAATDTVVDKATTAVLVGEKEQGETDLNGDGDATDSVAAAYDGRTGVFTIIPLATAHLVLTRFGVVHTWIPVPPLIAGDAVALLVDERDQGGIDLNGDADATDHVLHLFEIDTGSVLNAGLAAATVPGGFGTPSGPVTLTGSGQKVMMLAGEVEQGGIDLNQDGDAADRVEVVIHARTGRVTVAK